MSDDVSSQSNNDLPNTWPIKTSPNSDMYHEDLPLFPPLIEKVKIEPIAEEILIESPIVEDKLESGIIKEEIKSGSIETVIDSGIATPDFEIQKAENPIIENNENILIDRVESEINHNTALNEVSSTSNMVDSKQKIIGTEKEDIDTSLRSNITTLNKTLNSSKPNLNLVKTKKQIPVPHAKINETIKTSHPLSLPPRVIPFSTPAPSVHTKIASVYTQPEARASTWLPWMRTSMWSKKMVKRVTRDPEIKEVHAGLPAINEVKKPNVIYSPIFVSPDIPLMDKNIFESKAEIIRMDEIVNKTQNKIEKDVTAPPPVLEAVVEKLEPIIEEKAPVQPVVSEIKDAVDNAIFGVSNIPQKRVDNNDVDAMRKIDNILKPKIEDSWDAALFS